MTRRKCWELLYYSQSGRPAARAIEVFLMVLIICNVVAVSIESVESIHQQYRWQFLLFEWFSVLIFSLEYGLRIWTAVEFPEGHDGEPPNLSALQRRLRFARQPMMLLDFIAIAPFFLALLLPVDLRFLRVLRLLRIFKLTRYSYAMNMLLEVIREEANSFLAGFFILSVMLVLAASGAYLAEHQVQPEKFGSIPAAMWWAVATLTTVGYGDVTPVTPLGRLFGAMVTVVGIGMAALPAGILANGMSNHLSLRREDLREQFRIALSDGVIDANEAHELEELRVSLGISSGDAESIRTEVEEAQAQQREVCLCPACGSTYNAETLEVLTTPTVEPRS